MAFGLSVSSVPASAGPMLWTLSGVTSDDGATATGSFDFDAATGQFSNILITIGGGSLAADLEGQYQYAELQFAEAGNIEFLMNPYTYPFTGQPILQLQPASPMTTSQATIPIVNGFVGTCSLADCSGVTFDSLALTAPDAQPFVSSAPEPTLSVSILFAFIGMAWRQSRIRHKRGY